MNLYRSFGSLLETWVTEGYPTLDSQGQPSGGVEVEELVEVVSGGQVDAFRSSSRDSLRFSGATARSESEDSGVELVSPGSPWASQQHVMAVAPQASGAGESEGRGEKVVSSGGGHLPTCPSSPALSIRSCPSSPSSSSSSSCQSIGSSLLPLPTGAPTSGARVEQALRRMDPVRCQVPRHSSSTSSWLSSRGDPDTLPWKHSSTANLSACSATGPQDCRSQKSQSFEQGEELTSPSFLPQTTGVQAAEKRLQIDPSSRPITQLINRLETQHTNLSSTPPTSRLQAQAPGENGWVEPSPGFLYLEQVCLMLERFAQLQMHSRGLQMEREHLRNQQNHSTTNRIQHSPQPSTVRQCSNFHTNEAVSRKHNKKTPKKHEATISSDGHDNLGELRQRSRSDAGMLTPYRHQRRLSKSIGNLLEEDEEETVALRTAESQEPSEREKKAAGKGLIQKIASLRRNEARPEYSTARSETLPRLGKKSSLRGLGKFFKKRSKTTST